MSETENSWGSNAYGKTHDCKIFLQISIGLTIRGREFQIKVQNKRIARNIQDQADDIQAVSEHGEPFGSTERLLRDMSMEKFNVYKWTGR